MTALGWARSFGYMNPSAFIEAAAATHRAVFGAFEDPVARKRTGRTLALSSGVAHAATGDLDPTFGTGGSGDELIVPRSSTASRRRLGSAAGR